MNVPRSLLALAVVGALGVGGAAGASAARSAPGATKVNVKLIEFKVLLTQRRAAPGKVTFVVKNAGKLSHELVVLRTPTAAGKLPTHGMTAVETGRIGKIPSFPPGQTRTLALTLKPGHYVLICNLPGHYKAGQFADFTVG